MNSVALSNWIKSHYKLFINIKTYEQKTKIILLQKAAILTVLRKKNEFFSKGKLHSIPPESFNRGFGK
jgi:hypothetical protein